MLDELDDAVMALEPAEELDFVSIALVRFCVGAFENDALNGVHCARCWTQHRVYFRRTALAEDTEAFIRLAVDLSVSR